MMSEVKSPFTRDVLKGPIIAEFEMPHIKPYSGEGDPAEHLEFFRSWMEMQGASEAVMCRAFSLTLAGVAQNWFMKFKPSSIGSFTQLSKSFITQFVGTAEVDSPFTREVLKAPIPSNFKMPQMEAYSGEGDPIEHLETFRSWMELYVVSSGAIMCRAFSLTLTGAARKWFRMLRPGSIGSFTQLGKLFITQFMMVAEIESPFTRKVREAPLPPNFKMPQVKIYNAEGDPREHLETFNSWMELYAVSDAIKCRAFSLTLAGGARDWFRSLTPGSIGSFTQLCEIFIRQFLKEAYRKKNSLHLYFMQQGENESLKDFLVRFNNEAMQVEGNLDSFAPWSMKSALQSNKFKESLEVNLPTSYAELMEKAYKYCHSDELMHVKTEETRISGDTKKRKF